MIKVVTPAASHDLIEVSDVTSGWGDASSFENTDIATAITAASLFIRGWCSRNFISQEYKEYCAPTFDSLLYPREKPVTEIASVSISDSAIDLDNIEFGFEDGGILLKNDLTWNSRVIHPGFLAPHQLPNSAVRDIEIQYTAGYALADVPADLKRACVVIVRHALKAEAGQPAGEVLKTKAGAFETEYQGTDAMTGSGSGYWAETLGDPTMMWIPVEARRTLVKYRRFML